jgi:hypothetical protein
MTMSERTIRLRTDTGGLADHAASQSHAGGGHPPSEEQVARFRTALAADGQGDADRTEAAASAAAGEQAYARGAFGLFGPARAQAQEMPGAPPERGPAWQLADQVAERILVSAEGAREVRVVVRDDVLAGVELRITQQQGRWVIGFVVTDAASFAAIERSGQTFADQLAQRLRCGVDVRLTDQESADGEPQCTFFADPPALQEGAS